MQSDAMENDWAAEHLQTIRTLMERSAVYRRALAPIMLFSGVLGIIGAVVGLCCHLDSMRQFATMWLVMAAVTVGGSFLIARRQAFKDSEPFWSPPTSLIAQALAPPLTVGMILGLIFATENAHELFYALIFLWAFFYGCAVHAAGFFISRGMRLFGWAYIGCAGVLACCHFHWGLELNPHCSHGLFLRRAAPGVWNVSDHHGERKECDVNPDAFLNLDRVIHEKGRLAIMSMLAASPELSFTELRDALSMTDGNVTTHIRTLQEAGYVSVAKSYQNNRPLTTVSLTTAGRKAFSDYVDLLEKIVQQTRKLK